MLSLSDELHVVSLSNPRNKPNQYETLLAKPLKLFNKWDVALIDIADLNKWTNLNKSNPNLLM